MTQIQDYLKLRIVFKNLALSLSILYQYTPSWTIKKILKYNKKPKNQWAVQEGQIMGSSHVHVGYKNINKYSGNMDMKGQQARI